MIFKVAICDDNENDRTLISSYLQQFEMEHDVDFEISIYNTSKEFLLEYTRPNTFHIVFLDVEMPESNGLEVATHIRNLPDKMVKIIFVSNYPQYMQNSFNVQAFHYLQKPLQYKTLKEQMFRIIEDHQSSHIQKLLVKEDGVEELIFLNDILCIETIKNKRGYLSITLTDHTIVTKGIFNEYESELANYSFISPHKGFLINIYHIHFFKDTSLILTNGLEIPLSRRKEKAIRTLFSKRIITIGH